MGSVPAEQQTCWFGVSVEQKVELGLYLVKSEGEMPHLVASVPHPSPEATGYIKISINFAKDLGTEEPRDMSSWERVSGADMLDPEIENNR